MLRILLLLALAPAVSATTLLWTPASGAVDGYRVYASTDGGQSWAVQPGVSFDSDQGYERGHFSDPRVLTLFQVRAFNEHGEVTLQHLLGGYDPVSVSQGDLPYWEEGAQMGAAP